MNWMVLNELIQFRLQDSCIRYLQVSHLTQGDEGTEICVS